LAVVSPPLRRCPYRQWIHEHTFEARDGGALARDVVHYAVPLDFLVHRWLVPPDIENIFAFRTRKLRKRFSTRQDQRHRPRRRQFVRAPSLFASQPGLG
jgi:hypothetical protein